MNGEEEHIMIVSPELIAYLKWLIIYTAAFKDSFAEPRGAIHTQLELDTLASTGKEKIFRKRPSG